MFGQLRVRTIQSIALLALLAAGCTASTSAAAVPAFATKLIVNADASACTRLRVPQPTQLCRAIKHPSDVVVHSKRRQNQLSSSQDISGGTIVELIGDSIEAIDRRIGELCPNVVMENTMRSPLAKREPRSCLRGLQTGTEAQPIVRKIAGSGSPSNRIDVVFMGDGYTLSEETTFFDDVQRLTDELFHGDTFAQYLPLFNIWAAFLPSLEPGIGIGGSPKDTAFGMYRDGTELRSIYTTKSKRVRAVCAAIGQHACDFPTLLANGDFYGGLDGEFVISTQSVSSGTTVLRHEVGHNFGQVGEEYDGGQVYSSANSTRSIASVPWKHWLTEPGKLVKQQSALLFQKHIWHDLNQGDYNVTFTSTGKYNRWYVKISVSGTDTKDSLSVTLDGNPLSWTSNGLKGRTFYTWTDQTSGSSSGSHTLQVHAREPFDFGLTVMQLCSAVVYKYKGEDAFKLDDYNGKCVMRNVVSTSFCSVCQENMWLKFMERIEFIDDLIVLRARVSVKLIPLAQLRPATDGFVQTNQQVTSAEQYVLQWLNDGHEVVQFRDQTDVDLSAEGGGVWTIRVVFYTPIVRLDLEGYMQSERTFTI